MESVNLITLRLSDYFVNRIKILGTGYWVLGTVSCLSSRYAHHCLLFANKGGGSPVNGFHRLMLLAPIPEALITALSP